MSLYYPELDKEQTKKIFKLNLELIEGRFKAQSRQLMFDDSVIINFTELHFDNHEHTRWNGRQIRNASQTALELAEFEALNESLSPEVNNSVQVSLKKDHFSRVRKAYLAFAKYLGDVFGTDGDQRAEENRLRARAEKNGDSSSKLMQRAADKSHAPFKGHRNENVGSRYNENEFQPTTQHIGGVHQNSGYVPPQGVPVHHQTSNSPARYGPLGVQQETYTYAQSSGLQQSNTPFNQPVMMHDSQRQPMSSPQQGWPGSNPNSVQLAYPRQMPMAQPPHPAYNQSYPQSQDGLHPQIQHQGSEQGEIREL